MLFSNLHPSIMDRLRFHACEYTSRWPTARLQFRLTGLAPLRKD
jgi:hypothetical protein